MNKKLSALILLTGLWSSSGFGMIEQFFNRLATASASYSKDIIQEEDSLYSDSNNALRNFFNTNEVLRNGDLRKIVLSYYEEFASYKVLETPSASSGFFNGARAYFPVVDLRFDGQDKVLKMYLKGERLGASSQVVQWDVLSGKYSGKPTFAVKDKFSYQISEPIKHSIEAFSSDNLLKASVFNEKKGIDAWRDVGRTFDNWFSTSCKKHVVIVERGLNAQLRKVLSVIVLQPRSEKREPLSAKIFRARAKNSVKNFAQEMTENKS